MITNVESFARIDQDRSRFEKECNQCYKLLYCIVVIADWFVNGADAGPSRAAAV